MRTIVESLSGVIQVFVVVVMAVVIADIIRDYRKQCKMEMQQWVHAWDVHNDRIVKQLASENSIKPDADAPENIVAENAR
jgi:predicted methyltransferase